MSNGDMGFELDRTDRTVRHRIRVTWRVNWPQTNRENAVPCRTVLYRKSLVKGSVRKVKTKVVVVMYKSKVSCCPGWCKACKSNASWKCVFCGSVAAERVDVRSELSFKGVRALCRCCQTPCHSSDTFERGWTVGPERTRDKRYVHKS
jgi:hypothetical protein